MVMVLEQVMVDEIARLGREAYPNEACGILIPTPIRGQSVFELPNRSKEPRDSVELNSEDIVLQLEAIYGDDVPYTILENIAWWHTHPSGNIGPSKFDMDNKPPKLKCLVVTIFPDDRAPVPAWF